MANEVKLIFKVTDDGTLKLVTDKAKKAKKATDDLTSSTDRATNARNRYNKAEKGVGSLGANSTKNFSKMNQTMGGSSGLVAAYATLAANAFALSAAFNALRKAAAFEQLTRGLTEIGASAGINLPYVAEGLRDVTNGAISAEQALRATAVATSSGFSPEQLTKLTKVAKGAATALGRDMGDALDRLVRGTAKLEPEILDELGIIVRLDDATRDYAAGLGKTSNQLNTFERQQAFLNATIEQGTKKFGEIADTVEVNAFDKLAASFADHTKSGLELINKVLVPVVGFLSSNPTALTGVLVLFASSIGKALIPSIQSIAATNKAVAKQAAISYQKSGKVISSEFKKVQASAIATAKSTKVLPASVEKMRSGYIAGTLSVNDLKKAVRQLKASEKLREVANKKRSGEAFAEKQIELNQIRALRIETENLIAAEATRTTANVRGATAKGRSTGAGLTARGLNQMEAATGFFQKLGIAAKYTRLQFLNVGKTFGKTTESLNRGKATLAATRVAFTALGGAVRLFGTALLSAIPFIGQGILLFSMFQEPIMKLINKLRGIDPEIEKVTKSFSFLDEVNIKLEKSLTRSDTAFEKFAATIKSKAGVFDTLESAIDAILEAQREDNSKEFSKNVDAIVEKQKELREEDERLRQNSLVSDFTRERKLDLIRQEIAILKERNKVVLEDPSTDPDVVRKAILVAEAFQDRIKNAGSALAAVLTDEDKKAIEKLIADLKEGKDIALALKNLKNYTDEYNSLDTAIKSIPNQISDINKESIALGAKAASKTALLADKYEALSNDLLTVRKSFKGSFDASTQEALEKIQSKIKDAYGEMVNLADGPSMVATKLREIDEELQTIAGRSAEAAEVGKEFAQVSRESAEAMALSINFQNKSVELLIREVDLLITRAKLILEEEERTRTLLELQTKKAGLEARLVDDIEKNFKVTQANIANEKRALDLQTKRENAAKATLYATLKEQKARLAVSQGGPLSAQQEINLERRQLSEKRNVELELLHLKLKSIDLEFDLLDAKLLFEKLRLQAINSDEEQLSKMTAKERADLSDAIAAFDNIEESSKATRLALKDSVKSVDRATHNAKKLELTLRQIALNAQITQKAFDLTSAKVELLRSAGMEQQALALEEALLKAEILDIQKEIARLMVKPAENRLELLEQEAKLTEKIAKLREKVGEKAARVSKNLGDSIGGTMGASAAGYAQIASLQAQIAQEEENLLEAQQRMQSPEYQLQGDMAGDSALTTTLVNPEVQSKAFKDMIEIQGRIREANRQLEIEMTRVAAAITSAFAESFSGLGPEGEIIAPVIESFSVLLSSMAALQDTVKNTTGDMEGFFEELEKLFDGQKTFMESMEKLGSGIAASFAMMSAAVSAFAALEMAESKQRVRRIDQQIEQEKKRDGKSKESVNRINQLEAKKDKIKRKAFEKDKKMKKAQAVLNMASGISAQLPGIPYTLPLIALIAALGMKQISIIDSMTYDGGGAASAGTPSSVSVGERRNTVDLAKSQSARGELGYFRGMSGQGGPENFKATGAFTGMKYRANGGNTAFMVGEQGPELFVPERPGTIIPNDEVAPAGQTNVSFNISTVDSTGVEDLLMNQRGNIIGMIREAANSYGQDFVEEVDTSVFGETTRGVSRY